MPSPFISFGLNSLRVRILVAVMLIFAPVLGLILLNADEDERQAFQRAQADILDLTHQLTALNDQQIENTRQLLVTMAQLPFVKEKDATACNPFIGGLMSAYPLYTGAGVVDAESGRFFCISLLDAQLVDVSATYWYQAVMQTRQFFIGRYQIAVPSGEPVIFMALPVLDTTGEITAVVVAGLSLDWLNEFVQGQELVAEQTITLTDAQGIVIAHHPPDPDTVGQPFYNQVVREAMLTQGTGTIQADDSNGTPRLHGFTRFGADSGALHAVVGLPSDRVLAGVNETRNRNLTALGAMIALVVTFAWVTSGVITQPIRALTQVSRQIAAGRLHSRSALKTNIVELDQMVSAFDDLAAYIEQENAESLDEAAATNRRLRQEIQERSDAQGRTRIMQQLTAGLSGAITSEQVARVVIERGLTPIGSHASAIFIPGSDPDRLCVLGIGGLHPPDMNKGSEIPLDLPAPPTDVYRSGQPLWIETNAEFSARYPQFQPPGATTHVQAMACLPLQISGQPSGVLSAAFIQPRTMDAEFRELMTTIANYCAQALERARLYETEIETRKTAEHATERVRRLQSMTTLLAEVMTTNMVARVIIDQGMIYLNANTGTCYLLRDENRFFQLVYLHTKNPVVRAVLENWQYFAVDTPIAATYAIQHKIGLWYSSAAEGAAQFPALAQFSTLAPGGYAVLPLMLGENALGVVTFSFDVQHHFSDEERDFMTALMHQCAGAFERARLFEAEIEAREAAEKNAERITRLQTIASALSESLTTEQIAQIIVDQAATYLGASSGIFYLVDNADQVLRRVYTRLSESLQNENFDDYAQIPLDPAMPVTQSIRAKRPIWFDSAEQAVAEYPIMAMFADTAPGGFIFYPVALRDQVIGMLSFSFENHHTFDEEQQALMLAIMQQFAQSLERVRLSNEAKESAAYQERQRLARDLHDAVSQTLFSAASMGESLPKQWERNPERGREILGQMVTLNRAALAEMRTLLLELRPEAVVKTRLKVLFMQLIDAARGRRILEAALDMPDEFPPLPPNVHVALYRVAQEAISNMLNHSEATAFSVSADHDGERVTLTIHDNGGGFEPSAVRGDRFGLGNMSERSKAVGATLDIISALGDGTTIRLIWKAEANQPKDASLGNTLPGADAPD